MPTGTWGYPSSTSDSYQTSPGTYGYQMPRSWGSISDWGGGQVTHQVMPTITDADLAQYRRPSEGLIAPRVPSTQAMPGQPAPQQQQQPAYPDFQQMYDQYMRNMFPQTGTLGGEQMGFGKTGGTGGGALRYNLSDIAAGNARRNQQYEDFEFIDPTRGGQKVGMTRPVGYGRGMDPAAIMSQYGQEAGQRMLTGRGGPGAGGFGGGPSLTDIMGSPRIQGLNMMYDVAGQRVQRGVGDMMQRAGLLQSGMTAEELSGRMQDLEAQRAAALGPMLQDEISRQAAGQYAMQQGLLPGYQQPPTQFSPPSGAGMAPPQPPIQQGLGGASPYNAQQAMQMLGMMGFMQQNP